MQNRRPQLCRVCDSFDVLPFDEHIMTKQHQVSVHKQEFALYRTTHGIFVNNLPNAVPKEEIISFFATYGTLLSSMVSDKNVYGIFEYKDKEVVTKLIATKRVTFKGRSITIAPRTPKPAQKYVNEDAPKVNPDEAINLLRSQSDIIAEIVKLQHYLQPVSRDVLYAALCMDLKSVLARCMPCMVYPFGSTVTGLDFITSDVDAYVYVDPRDGVCGRITGDALARRLVEIIPQFLSSSQLFMNIVSIPNASTPIIKCVHGRTGIACDINFKNMLGVCNSYLIKKYLSYNRRLTLALVIIKYWAKVHNLTGVGKFSNYAITVLFLFCFMQKPFNLPNVFSLQQNHNSNQQDGWEAGFEFGNYTMNQALMKLGVAEIILEFFKYFASFNFADLVMCPYIGRSLERSVFQQGGQFPIEYDKYRERLATSGLYPTTPICVQDCFELCRNVTRAVRQQEFDEFVDLCNQGVKVLSENNQNLHLYPIFFDTYCTDEDTFQFVLIETNKLNNHLRKNLNNPNDNNESLFQNFVKDFITRLLTQVYLLDVIIDINESPNKISSSPPVKLQKKNFDNHDFNIVFECSSHIDVWTSRTVIAKDQSKIEDECIFDAEVRLSDYIANNICKKLKTKSPIVKFKVTLSKGDEIDRDVKVVLTNEGANLFAYKEFSILFVKFVKNFFQRYIQSIIIEKTPAVNEVAGDKK